MLRRRAFTMMEVLVVIIIIVILSSMLFPKMRRSFRQACAVEAIGTLRSIHSHMRLMRSKTGAYNITPAGNNLVAPFAVVNNIDGFIPGDLNSRYFHDNDYSITAVDQNDFVARAAGNGAQVGGVVITIDQDGNLTETY